jgi:hypothetical protein
MIETARRRMRAKTRMRPSSSELLATEELSKLGPRRVVRRAFSNFSGLNCVADLHLTAHQLAAW